MKKYNLKGDTKIENELNRVDNYPINPRDSKIPTDKRLVIIDKGQQVVLNGIVSTLKIIKHFNSTVSAVVLTFFLFRQLSKPTTFHWYETKKTSVKYAEHIADIFSTW